MQTKAVPRSLARGGNLFVTHYLYSSAVDMFRTSIRLGRESEKQIMRIGRCTSSKW
jgi:hypothetical protein